MVPLTAGHFPLGERPYIPYICCMGVRRAISYIIPLWVHCLLFLHFFLWSSPNCFGTGSCHMVILGRYPVFFGLQFVEFGYCVVFEQKTVFDRVFTPKAAFSWFIGFYWLRLFTSQCGPKPRPFEFFCGSIRRKTLSNTVFWYLTPGISSVVSLFLFVSFLSKQYFLSDFDGFVCMLVRAVVKQKWLIWEELVVITPRLYHNRFRQRCRQNHR